MPPRRRRKAAAAAAAAAAADAAEARQLDSFVTRFWDAQGSEVGVDIQERIQYLLAAAKKILDAAGPASHLIADDRKERVGVATAIPRGNMLVLPAQDAFETAARVLSTETDWDMTIGIPNSDFPVYHPQALLHLFAAVIGMLAPNMRVRIVGNVELHKRIMVRLKTRQYVTLSATFRGAFDVVFDATEGSDATTFDHAERSIEKNNALLLYVGPNIYTEICSCIDYGLWLKCLMMLRRRHSHARVSYEWLYKLLSIDSVRWCSGALAVLCDMIQRADSDVLNYGLVTVIQLPMTNHVSDETILRNVIIAAFGDGSNGVRLWPALNDVFRQPRLLGSSYRERFCAFAKVHHDALVSQTKRAALIRTALHPPTPGVILMALAVIPLVVAYLDHALEPIPPEWLPAEQPRPAAKSHAGVKRKAPSTDTDIITAIAAPAAAAAPANTDK